MLRNLIKLFFKKLQVQIPPLIKVPMGQFETQEGPRAYWKLEQAVHVNVLLHDIHKLSKVLHAKIYFHPLHNKILQVQSPSLL